MERIITGVVDWQLRSITLNGIVMSLDKYDAFFIDVEELFIVDDPIAYGEKEIANVLTEEEQILFYTIMANSKVMTLTAMANVLKKNTGFIKELFTLALSRGLLMLGWNSTYKVVSKNMRERMIAKAAKLTEAKANMKPKLSTKELIKQSSDMNASTNLQELYSEEEEEMRMTEASKIVAPVSNVQPIPRKLPSRKPSQKLPVKKK